MQGNFSKNDKAFVSYIRSTVNKALYKWDLIQEGDKIILGLSGGKDSLSLLEILALQRKYYNKKFDLLAVYIHIDNSAYQINEQQVKNLCDSLEVPFLFENVVLEDKKEGRNICFICSWTRRKVLFNLTNKLNYNKLALGHHLDDAIETMMMNMTFHGTLSSLPPKLSMFDKRIELIRPLMLLKNEEMQRYADILQFPKLKVVCPYDSESQRTKMRNMINQLEKINPATRINLFNSMSHIYDEYLPPREKIHD